jgi:hypothetical protein
MIVGLAIGWILGIGTAILLLHFAAATLADRALEEMADTEERIRARSAS